MGITNQTPWPLNRTTSLCVACSPATPDGLPPSSPPRRTLTPSCHPPVTRLSSSGSSPARTPSTASLSVHSPATRTSSRMSRSPRMASSPSPAHGTAPCVSGTSAPAAPPVALSVDNRQIVSASRDKSIKLWNTLGECKYTIGEQGGAEGHTEWVSCVNFVPNQQNPSIVSGGWDKIVKVWNMSNCKLRTNLVGHSGYINAVTVSPDGSLCASGGKDGVAMLWDLNEGKRLYSLPCEQGDIIHALCFSPNRYWLCAGTDTGIRIWDLEGKGIVDELKLELPVRDPKSKALPTSCISLAWSSDGNTLFAGYTDTMIRAWQVTAGQNTIF